MDRAATLAMLGPDRDAGRGVVFFHDAHPDTSENRWFKTLREVTDRYSKDSSHIAERKSGGHRRYEPILFASAFTSWTDSASPIPAK